MVLEALGVGVVFATMWAALQFEGTPGVEGGASSDDGGVFVPERASVARITELQIPDRPCLAMRGVSVRGSSASVRFCPAKPAP